MPSIEIKSALKIGMDEVLTGISTLDTPDLEQFLKEVAYLLAQRKIKSISERESALLLKINKRLLPETTQNQYDSLYKKLQEERISPKEHTKLLSLIKKREKKGGERLAALVELAQLRKISPKELMKDLGIDSLSYA